MCNAITLQSAVLLQVREFAQNNQSFSAHDITRSIREKTRNGELEIPEVEVQGASFQFDISHGRVKSIFEDLWRTGAFDSEFTLSRQFVNNMYFLYTPTLVAGNSQPPTNVTAPAPVAIPASGNTPTATPTAAQNPVSNPPSTKLDATSVEARVREYLINCASRQKFHPTIKQVQSAIKRDTSTHWTCSEICDLIEHVLRIPVNRASDFASFSVVLL